MRIIAGEARGKKLLAPKDRSTRPPLDRMRESVFSILADCFVERNVMDLFAGVGCFGLEALSRGASGAMFVEQSRTTHALLQQNVENLGFRGRCEVVRGNALVLPELSAVRPPGFALVFLDPPFKMFDRTEDQQRLFQRLEQILTSPALEAQGIVVLRQPTQRGCRCPFSARETRTYGESVIHFLEGGSTPPTPSSGSS